MLKEHRRIIRKDGICSHRIDLKDHMGGGLNNLRFSEKWWESRRVKKAGIYTNRIRFNKMISMFSDAGFKVNVIYKNSWNTLPLPIKKMADNFKDCTKEDLLVSGFDVILEPI